MKVYNFKCYWSEILKDKNPAFKYDSNGIRSEPSIVVVKAEPAARVGKDGRVVVEVPMAGEVYTRGRFWVEHLAREFAEHISKEFFMPINTTYPDDGLQIIARNEGVFDYKLLNVNYDGLTYRFEDIWGKHVSITHWRYRTILGNLETAPIARPRMNNESQQ